MKRLQPETYIERFGDRTVFPAGEPRLYEAEAADFRLPKRRALSHKYSYGRALVIAGSRGYSGAPVLAANACERSGAGLTHLMVPESIYPVAAARCDGTVVTPLPADGQGRIAASALPEILRQLEKAQACVIGPGLGTGEETRQIVETVLREASCPLVLDADALTLNGQNMEAWTDCRTPLILTPHEGEFHRLGGELTQGRLAGALRFCEKRLGTILLLKGYGTLICRRGEVCVNPTGGPAMAKGGSGDVLSGILCALLAQGFEPWFAARAAAWLHGRAGDLAAAALGEYSLAPSDLICFLPAAFRELSPAEGEA